MAADVFWRLASATRLATAQDASRVITESARLVRMMGPACIEHDTRGIRARQKS
jgi:hypothetical protein